MPCSISQSPGNRRSATRVNEDRGLVVSRALVSRQPHAARPAPAPRHAPRRALPLLGLISSITLVALAPAVADEPSGATLFWKNGDQLPGLLLKADATTIHWQSTVFPTPFVLSIDPLEKIQYDESPTGSVSDMPFRVVTVDHDVLYGDLLELTREHVVLRSPRQGSVHLDRSKLMALQRANRPSSGAVSLGLLSDWSILHRGREVSEWTRDGGGRLVTKVTGAELFRDLHLNSLSIIEVTLGWEGKPGFLLSFADPDAVRLSRQVVKLETWENDLVLQTLGANGDFEVLHTIPADSQSIDLRLQWNPILGELKVYTFGGQLLGTMRGKEEGNELLSGLYLQNKGVALALTRLRITGAHGATLAGDLPPGVLCVHLDDASSAIGSVENYDSSSGMLTMTPAAGGSRQIPLERVDSIEFANPPAAATSPTSTRFSFADGTVLSGTLESLDDGVARIQSAFSDRGVTVGLEGITDLRFGGTSVPSPEGPWDVATIGELRLHGQLAPLPHANQALGWQPEGSANASPFPADRGVHVVRASSEDRTDPAPNRFVDRLFLRNGDAVPCLIHGIDESSAQADFPMTDSRHIDRRLLLAAEFGAFAPARSHGLDDPRWVVTEMGEHAVQRANEQIVVNGETMIGYPDIRDVSEIKFDIQWEPLATAMIQIHMFSRSPAEVAGHPTLLLYRTGGNQMVLQAAQGEGGNRRPIHPFQINGGRNSFRIRMANGKILVHEGDTEVLALPSNGPVARGKSFTLCVKPLHVNGGAAAAAGDKQKLLTILNVEVRRSGGDLRNALVDEDEKNRLLTVPRFRKQSPPTEILVGCNGDLLRGRLVALDQHQATFQSRLEQLQVARNRLSGIIWPLSPEEDFAEDAADAFLARIVFGDGTILRMTADQLIDGSLSGRHPGLGGIAVPLTLIRELSVGPRDEQRHPNPFASWTLRRAEEPSFTMAQQSPEGSGTSAPEGSQSPLVGRPAPPFTAEMLDATQVRVPDDNGRVVVLDFWATWCGPCVKSMPQTFSTVAQFPREKVVLMAVNQLETPDAIRQFLEARGWEVPVALDRAGEIGKLFQIDSLPQLVVIGPDRKVQRVFLGDRPETQEQLKELLVQLTAETTDAAAESR